MKIVATEEEFMRLVIQGVECWRDAGRILVAMMAKNPNVKSKILQKHPELSPNILATFERIGRGDLHPMLMLSESPGYKAARELPMSDQEKIVSEKKVDLLIFNDGKADVLKADVRSLTAEQTRQVFARDHLRDASEQRLWIEDKRKPSLVTTSWIIEGDTVRFRKGVTLSSTQLAGILEQMVKKATQPKS